MRSRTTATEMNAAAATAPDKLLGLFNPGNMDGVLDRRFLKGGTVKKFPDQPDLTEQVRAALDVLSRKPARLLPDGRVRPDRQIHPRARHGARGLRHHHARQRREAGARLGGGARRRHADPGGGRPQPSDQPDRHHRRRHDGSAQGAAARARRRLRQGRLPELSGARRGGLSAARRRQPAACDLLGKLAGLLRDVPAEARRSERADRDGRDARTPSSANERYRTRPARCCGSATCRDT